MGKFREARESVLELPDLETETFDLIVQWVYTGEYHIPNFWHSDCWGGNYMKNGSYAIVRPIDFIRWADRFLEEEDQDITEKALELITLRIGPVIENLTSEAIEAAFSMKCYTLKCMIASQCTIPYLLHQKDSESPSSFKENLEDTPEFASFILEAVVESISKRTVMFGGNAVDAEVELKSSETLNYRNKKTSNADENLSLFAGSENLAAGSYTAVWR